MKYIYIGKIVNTHGIKGELRLISDFKFKEKVFKKGMEIYIGKNKDKEVILSYRKHKNFDMICMEGYDNINQILKYKGNGVYINSDSLSLGNNEYLDEDIENYNVIVDNKLWGHVVRIERYEKNNLIVVNNGKKDFLIPFVSDIIEIDLKKKQVLIKNVAGLLE